MWMFGGGTIGVEGKAEVLGMRGGLPFRGWASRGKTSSRQTLRRQYRDEVSTSLETRAVFLSSGERFT